MLAMFISTASFREVLAGLPPARDGVEAGSPSTWTIKSFDMVIRRYPDGVIHEFDSVDELRNFGSPVHGERGL